MYIYSTFAHFYEECQSTKNTVLVLSSKTVSFSLYPLTAMWGVFMLLAFKKKTARLQFGGKNCTHVFFSAEFNIPKSISFSLLCLIMIFSNSCDLSTSRGDGASARYFASWHFTLM